MIIIWSYYDHPVHDTYYLQALLIEHDTRLYSQLIGLRERIMGMRKEILQDQLDPDRGYSSLDYKPKELGDTYEFDLENTVSFYSQTNKWTNLYSPMNGVWNVPSSILYILLKWERI